MNPILFVILLTAATGVGGLAQGGALAAHGRRESPPGARLRGTGGGAGGAAERAGRR